MTTRLLTIQEAADRLRIHPQTLRRLLERGALEVKHLRLGGKYSSWRISAEDLERFIAETWNGGG